MASDLLSIGLRGLLSAKKNIDVTGHNISNVNTPGYSRQNAIQTNTSSASDNTGYGSSIVDVRRNVSDFSQRELINSNVESSYWTSQSESQSSLENIVNNISTQMSASIHALNNAYTQLGTNTSSSSFQQDVNTQQKIFVQNAKNADKQMTSMEKSMTDAIVKTVDGVNQSFQQLADLNVKIEWAQQTGKSPNDLLDQRDNLIQKIQSTIGGQTLHNDSNVNLFSEQGQMYVFEDKALALSYENNQLSLVTSSGKINLPRTEVNGSIAGLMDSLSSIQNTHNKVNEWSMSTALTYNQKNTSGLTKDGVVGQNVFSVQDIQVTGNNPPKVRVNGVTSLTTIAYDGTNFAVTTKDGTTTQTTVPHDVNGLSLTWPSPISSGSWSFAPPTDIQQLTITGNGTASSNPYISSNANVQAYVNNNTFNNQSFSLAWNNNAATLTMADGNVYNGNIDNGHAYINNMRFDISSASGNGSFSINTGALNNGNAKIDTTSLLAYGKDLIANVGFHVSNINNMIENVESYKDTITQQHQSISGVSLDEEASNLISYQQAYSAASQVIKLSKDLFEEILGVVR